MNTSTLAVALLAMLAVGGVVYALLYPTLSGEKRAEKRRKEFAGPSTARGIDREAQARNKRGQIAQSLKDIENRGDEILFDATEELFSGKFDALHVLKLRDIYKGIENALDMSSIISDVIVNIVLKHS